MKLNRRGSNFHIRIRVPSDLVQLIGRTEIHQSLRTTDGRTARSRALTVRNAVHQSFEQLRLARIAGSDEDQLRSLSNQFLNELGSTRRKTTNGDMAHSNSIQTFSSLINLYLAEKADAVDPRSHMAMRYSFALAVDLIGDIDLQHLNRAICREYREALRQTEKFKLRDEKSPVSCVGLLSDKSVNKHITYLSSMLRWGVREELIHGNPAEGLCIRKRSQDWDERFAYSCDDVPRLFDGLWARERRQDRRWIPLIGLFTGMRLEEICQLRRCDFRNIDGIPCVRVTEDAGALKSASAERVVPIHPQLIDLGLLETLGVPEDSADRLWPLLSPNKFGKYSTAISKWFTRYKRRQGFDDTRYCFHSLRHTFVNELKQCDVPEPVIRQLVGHKEGSITFGRYGKGYEIRKLSDSIAKLKFNIRP